MVHYCHPAPPRSSEESSSPLARHRIFTMTTLPSKFKCLALGATWSKLFLAAICILALTTNWSAIDGCWSVPTSSSSKRRLRKPPRPSGVTFSSGTLYDEAYNLAMAEVLENARGGRFIAGAGWTQMWTRDTAYAVDLAAGLLYPDISRASMEACTEEVRDVGTVWLQDDCGHFGGWPNLSDAIVGAQGAWAYYIVSGDLSFLGWAYNVTRNSLIRAEQDVFDEPTGLFRGCSSFMESNSGYPHEYHFNGELVGRTKALSTNVLYYNGYKLGAMMGVELGGSSKEVHDLNEKSATLRKAIHSRLWMPEHGYYSYFEDGNDVLVSQMEGLGESLALLAPDFERDPRRIDSIFRNVNSTERGIPCLWPRFNNDDATRYLPLFAHNLPWLRSTASYYHNGRVWPFVQGYWAVAAASHGEIDVFADEFEKLLNLSRLKDTFAEFYELDGFFPKERRRQFWSAVGFLSMVYRGLFGMVFTPTGIRFKPVKPASSFPGEIVLREVVYRGMVLDISLKGSGSTMKSFKLDGSRHTPLLPSYLSGRHTVEVILEDSFEVGTAT